MFANTVITSLLTVPKALPALLAGDLRSALLADAVGSMWAVRQPWRPFFHLLLSRPAEGFSLASSRACSGLWLWSLLELLLVLASVFAAWLLSIRLGLDLAQDHCLLMFANAVAMAPA